MLSFWQHWKAMIRLLFRHIASMARCVIKIVILGTMILLMTGCKVAECEQSLMDNTWDRPEKAEISDAANYIIKENNIDSNYTGAIQDELSRKLDAQMEVINDLRNKQQKTDALDWKNQASLALQIKEATLLYNRMVLNIRKNRSASTVTKTIKPTKKDEAAPVVAEAAVAQSPVKASASVAPALRITNVATTTSDVNTNAGTKAAAEKIKSDDTDYLKQAKKAVSKAIKEKKAASKAEKIEANIEKKIKKEEEKAGMSYSPEELKNAAENGKHSAIKIVELNQKLAAATSKAKELTDAAAKTKEAAISALNTAPEKAKEKTTATKNALNNAKTPAEKNAAETAAGAAQTVEEKTKKDVAKMLRKLNAEEVADKKGADRGENSKPSEVAGQSTEGQKTGEVDPQPVIETQKETKITAQEIQDEAKKLGISEELAKLNITYRNRVKKATFNDYVKEYLRYKTLTEGNGVTIYTCDHRCQNKLRETYNACLNGGFCAKAANQIGMKEDYERYLDPEFLKKDLIYRQEAYSKYYESMKKASFDDYVKKYLESKKGRGGEIYSCDERCLAKLRKNHDDCFDNENCVEAAKETGMVGMKKDYLEKDYLTSEYLEAYSKKRNEAYSKYREKADELAQKEKEKEEKDKSA